MSGQLVVASAAANHAAPATSPPNHTPTELPPSDAARGAPSDAASVVTSVSVMAVHSAQHVGIDALGERLGVGSGLDDLHELQLVGVARDLALEVGTGRLMVMRVAAQHGREVGGAGGRVLREHRCGLVGVVRGPLPGL